MADPNDSGASWIREMPDTARAALVIHLLGAVDKRQELSAEEQLVSWEIGLGEWATPAQALEVWRGLSVSMRRQEVWVREIAEHLEAMAALVAGYYDLK